jgi:hypothetical protein
MGAENEEKPEMRQILSVAAIAVTVAAVPAFATQDNDGADSQRRICRTLQSTGSILPPRRQCRTQAEWDQLTKNSQRALDARANSPLDPSSSGSSGQ